MKRLIVKLLSNRERTVLPILILLCLSSCNTKTKETTNEGASPLEISLYSLMEKSQKDPDSTKSLIGQEVILSDLYINSISNPYYVKEESQKLSDNKPTASLDISVIPYKSVDGKIRLLKNLTLGTYKLPQPAKFINDEGSPVTVYVDFYDDSYKDLPLQDMFSGGDNSYEGDPLYSFQENVLKTTGVERMKDFSFFRSEIKLKGIITEFGDWTEGMDRDTKNKINNFNHSGRRLSDNIRITIKVTKVLEVKKVESEYRTLCEKYLDLPNNMRFPEKSFSDCKTDNGGFAEYNGGPGSRKSENGSQCFNYKVKNQEKRVQQDSTQVNTDSTTVK